MKCKCVNNSRFPQFIVGQVYTFAYEDKWKTRVSVNNNDGTQLNTDLGNFLFSFVPLPAVEYYISARDIEDFEREEELEEYKRRIALEDPFSGVFI